MSFKILAQHALKMTIHQSALHLMWACPTRARKVRSVSQNGRLVAVPESQALQRVGGTGLGFLRCE